MFDLSPSFAHDIDVTFTSTLLYTNICSSFEYILYTGKNLNTSEVYTHSLYKFSTSNADVNFYPISNLKPNAILKESYDPTIKSVDFIAPFNSMI